MLGAAKVAWDTAVGKESILLLLLYLWSFVVVGSGSHWSSTTGLRRAAECSRLLDLGAATLERCAGRFGESSPARDLPEG